MGVLQINTEKMGEFLQKRYIVRSKMIIDRSPVPVRDADNCAIWRYQPVPALSWPVVSAVLVEWRVLCYVPAGFGMQLFRAK